MGRIYTELVDIILALSHFSRIEEPPYIGLLSHSTMALGQDDEFVAGNAVFLDRLPDDLFADSVRVDVCCVPCVEASVVGGFEER